jgi:hypothetical protein
MKPIIFSTPMVQAILEGRKTQTRRVIKPQPSSGVRKSVFVKSGIEDGHGREIKPKYQPGDVLWVREAWATVSSGIIEYKATYIEPYTGSTEIGHIGKKIIWRPSIHMPREAARIFLRVKTVRIERVQDITEEDARAEGVKGIPRSRELYSSDDYIYPFKQLWDSINAKRGYGWDTNPWVWVVEFERISKEETYKKEG